MFSRFRKEPHQKDSGCLNCCQVASLFSPHFCLFLNLNWCLTSIGASHLSIIAHPANTPVNQQVGDLSYTYDENYKSVTTPSFTFYPADRKTPPNNENFLEGLEDWEAAMNALGANGPVGVISLISGEQQPGAGDAIDALNKLSDKIKKLSADRDAALWIKVEGDCCQEGFFDNSYNKKSYYFNCSYEVIGENAEPGEKKRLKYLKKHILRCYGEAKKRFEMDQKASGCKKQNSVTTKK